MIQIYTLVILSILAFVSNKLWFKPKTEELEESENDLLAVKRNQRSNNDWSVKLNIESSIQSMKNKLDRKLSQNFKEDWVKKIKEQKEKNQQLVRTESLWAVALAAYYLLEQKEAQKRREEEEELARKKRKKREEEEEASRIRRRNEDNSSSSYNSSSSSSSSDWSGSGGSSGGGGSSDSW